MDEPFPRIRTRYADQPLRARLRLWQRWTGSPFRAVARWVPPDARVADLGCGFGLFSGLLALEPGRDVVGVDVDAGKIDHARRVWGDLPNVRFACADLGVAPLPDADCVVFYDVLHHVADADALLAAAYARLPPGGLLVVKENDTGPPHKRLVSELVERVAVGLSVTRSAPVRFRSRGEWSDALARVGFRVHVAEHLHAREGFFVPHSLFVASR
jgi:2-polyprenyl-6-hydroxyphenyl methylase/3-demethylubiquinone-9 3-methyltransferase